MKISEVSKIDASRFLLILIIVLLVTGIVFGILNLGSNPIDDIIASNRVINILFVIEDNKTPVSTYVLMFYPETNRAAVFDLPGELGLLIARINRVDRIDRVYEPSRIGSYVTEIEKLLGIEINFSAVITKENLVSMVDLLEGVEIFIPAPVSQINDNELILFPSGMTVLDGDKAGSYATYSLYDEDREMEIFRRQRFFLGLFERWIRMKESIKDSTSENLFYSFFRTSMNQRTLLRLFEEFSYLNTSRINIQSVGGNTREVSGQMLIIPHWDGNLVKEVVRQTLGTLTRQAEDVSNERTLTVEVLNGTAVNGLAGRTAEMLGSFGYDIISIGNADRSNYDSTVIIHRMGDDNLVQSFADVIRCNNIRRELDISSEPENFTDFQNIEYKADITLIIGRNFNGRYVTGN